MPVSNHRREHKRIIRGRRPRRVRLWLAVSTVGVASLLLGGLTPAQVAPRVPLTALPGGPAGQALLPGSNLRQPQILGGKFEPYQVNGNIATITQKDAAGILRWGSFDIGRDAALHIVQPSSSAVLLNKVDGGAFQNKTVIEGLLSGNGQVYIYNPNGIIFGKTAEVNVNSLVASSLNIDNARFLSGILSPSTSAIFSTDASLAAGLRPGAVSVEGEAGQQARISAANGGRILLAAPTVSNSGILSAPDGQVALAAGGSVFLASPTDLRMRGLLIEVNNANLASRGGANSSASNEALGKILVERGNASLVGLAVNQMGQVSATTSVALNGSIFLRARDGASKSSATVAAQPTNGGSLVLGPGSVTEVRPTLGDTSTVAGSAFTQSWVDLAGRNVHLQGNAGIVAPAGLVDVTARVNPALADNGANARVYLEPGASINVAGTDSTRLAMESNVIEVQLRGTELADFPLNRDSPIRGSTVAIDVRKGTRVANVQGYLDLVGHNVGELTASGGTVTLRADRDVILAADSKINVSGGAVTYERGYAVTSQLKSQAALFDIGIAKNERIYDAVETWKPSPGGVASAPPARYLEESYREGRSAGAIRLDAANLVVRGDLAGSVSPGPRQRELGGTDASRVLPKGGELVLGNPDSNGLISNSSQFDVRGTIAINGTGTASTATPGFAQSLDAVDPQSGRPLFNAIKSGVDIDAGRLTAAGFSRLRAYTLGDITVGADAKGGGIDLGPGGELSLAAQNAINIGAAISAPGGKVGVASALSSITVAANTAVDLAGRWTNDRGADAPRDAQGNRVAPIVSAGGTLALAAQTIELGADASVDVSGGALQSATGSISGGAAGSIAVDATPSSNTAPLSASLKLGTGVSFRAYGLASGGRLRLSARNVLIGRAAADPQDLGLTDLSLFRSGGFASVDIRASANLTVASEVNLAPTIEPWRARSPRATDATILAASGLMASAFDKTGTAGLAQAGPPGTRAAASLSLSAAAEQTDGAGRLWIEPGATIVTEAGGTITLAAGRQLTVDGTLRAPGGAISLLLTPEVNQSLAYRPERSVWLGAAALLDARGTDALTWRNAAGSTQGDLLDGGSIRIGRLAAGNLTAAPGYVVIEAGARLDVSGARAEVALAQVRGASTTMTAASAGGSIDLRAREGLLIGGTLSGAGGNPTVAGGSLSVVLDRENVAGGTDYPSAARNLVIGASLAGTPVNGVPTSVFTGLAAERPITGVEASGRVSAATLNNGGFDTLRVKSQDQLSFDFGGGNLALGIRERLTLDAPILAARNAGASSQIDLRAAYAQIGNSDWRYQASGASAVATPGTAAFSLGATTIDLIGSSVTQGFGSTAFNASGDIRFQGQINLDLAATPSGTGSAISAAGAFSTAVRAAFTSRQAYPTTLSNFSLGARHFTNAQGQVVTGSISGDGVFCGDCIEVKGSIAFNRFNDNQGWAATPLSAAGTLDVSARDITQNGVLRAPFGSITLAAADNLSFGAGSVTSVAADRTIPLGRINNGREWLYDYGNGNTVTFNSAGAANSVRLPAKAIVAAGNRVTAAPGALIDASGGGDLTAYEFTPGPGGSTDILAKSQAPGAAATFAILPGYSAAVAPSDFQAAQDAGLKPGERIYLSGMSGLAAGFYTLLPAHYALLPGGFAVSAVAGTRDMQAAANTIRSDGSALVAGYRAAAQSADSRWAGFQVLSAEQVRKRSEFSDALGSSLSAGGSGTPPQDGGRIAFAASTALALDGSALLGAGSGGRRGSADISAPDITIVADRAQDTGTSLKLVAADLAALGADSLLVGGLREVRSDGTHVAVGARNVTLDNPALNGDGRNVLSGREIILAARDTVLVKSGSVLRSSGVPGAVASDLIVDGVAVNGKFNAAAAASGADADGALLRVSGAGAVAVRRNAPAGATGTLDIRADASVGASGSLNLDATRALLSAGRLEPGAGTAVNLGASRISLGDAIPGTVKGLKFDRAALAGLGNLSSLGLTSYSTIDTYGSFDLGSGAMQSLTLRAAGIAASGGANDRVRLVADTLRFEGDGGFAPGPRSSAGRLSVEARDIVIGSHRFEIRGFDSVALDARREVRADGLAGVLAADRDLTVGAGQITASSGKDGALAAGNALRLGTVANPEAPASQAALGGSLNFSGNTIVSDARIVASAGRVALNAAQGLQVTGGAIDVAGTSTSFGSGQADARGGSIALDGGSAGVLVAAAATLDLSASGADAGSLTLKAGAGAAGGTATVTLDGLLRGAATAGADGKLPPQASLKIEVDRLAGFGALNQKLDASGFTNAREFRVRQGDLSLAAGDRITARDVLVSVDRGNLTIGGSIDASGAKGGSIQLYAGQATANSGQGNLTVQNSARLLANATTAASSGAGSIGDGGRVVLGVASADGVAPAATAGNSAITLQAAATAGGSAATIDVSGNGAGRGGSVTLRAPRVGAGSDVAINGLGALGIIGSGDSVVEAVKVYSAAIIGATAGSASNLDARTTGSMFTEATAFSANRDAIMARLGADPSVKLRAGIEVRSTGDLQVSVNETATLAADRGWNLNAWRFGGEPIALALRAGGNLTVRGSISDGFVRPTTTSIGMPGWQLDPGGGAAASYRLVGGADLAAANPLEVKPATTSGDVRIAFARLTGPTNGQPVALVRTGTGRIDVAAGRDVLLDILNPGTNNALGATLYTAGRVNPLESGFSAPRSQTLNLAYAPANSVTTPQFANDGGAITVAAGRDVVGAPTAQLINNWLFRTGRSTTDSSGATVFATSGRGSAIERLQTAWWTRYDYFNQGIATFAGGDIKVAAAGNITDLSVSAASNGQVSADASARPLARSERGGADVSVAAGGNILGGATYVQKGDALISAGASITTSGRRVEDTTLAPGPGDIVGPSGGTMVLLRSVLALGDGSITVNAGRDLAIESVINPTMTRQSTNNAAALTTSTPPANYGYFSTYAPTSAVRLTSLAGNVLLGNNADALSRAGGSNLRAGLDSSVVGEGAYITNYQLYPGSLMVAAPGGNIAYEHGFSLSPAPAGQLELLAAGSVRSNFVRNASGNLVGNVQPIVMLDRDPATMPGVLNPGLLSDSDFNILRGAGIDGLPYHTSGGLHANDRAPVRIVALAGDISGENYFNNLGLGVVDTLNLAKRAEIIAGGDIKDLGFKIQNLNAGDVTRLSAGRDLIDSTSPANPSVVRHVVTGPGVIDASAGRNVDLGNGVGITTRGNILNPYLPEGGAAIVVSAGARADYAGFAQQRMAPTDLPLADQEALKAYVSGLNPALPANPDLATAWAEFGKLDGARRNAFLEARKPVLDQIYFAQLRSAVGAVGGGKLDLPRFDAVIASLFPATAGSGGDINVFGSQFRTEQGGAIDLFAPGGSIFAGLVNVPATLRSKSAAELGVFTIRGGPISAQVKNDFLVNQGRVFSLGGGDITLASQFGNIDAGRGAKTAVSAPPPLLRTDANGNTVVDIAGSIAGSGIATLKTSAEVAASNVYPIAPRGTFDAGDAGLRSSGTVVIVADKVVNASNIVAAGSVSGSKAADTSGLGGAVAAPPAAPVTKAESFSSAAAPNPDAASTLTVEFLGYGAVASAAPPAGGVPVTGAAAAKPAVPPVATLPAAPGKPAAKPGTTEQQAQ